MPQDTDREDREALVAAYGAALSSPARDIGLRAVAAAAKYPGMDLASLMQESEAMASALTTPRAK